MALAAGAAAFGAAAGGKSAAAVGSTLATAGTIASGAVSAIGAIQQGKAASAQANFQAAVANQQAAREREIAGIQAEDFRRDQQRLMASRRAAQGASGVESGTGSSLLVSEDFAAETELQALRILSGGETKATRLDQEAQLQRLAGKNARTQSFFAAGGSLLSGASRGASIMADAPKVT